MKKKAETKATMKVVTLEGQASKEIPKEVIIEFLKTLIREEKIRHVPAND